MRLAATLQLTLALLFATSVAAAQKQGFQLNRYEPTAPGEATFLVDHPWYSGTRYLSAGLTLNYGHDPLVLGRVAQDGSFSESRTVIAHQMLMHLDVAGSLFDRVTLGLSLPIVLLERGEEAFGVRPLDGGAISDPRIHLVGRLFGQPDRSPFSLSLGAWLWVPLRKFASLPPQTSDEEVRVLPKIIAGGVHRWLRWSATLGFLFREGAVLGTLGNPAGSSVGSSVQLGLSAAYHDVPRRFTVGPELLLSTMMTDGRAFSRDATGLDVLFGGHYHLLRLVQLGLAAGFGALRDPGTPDFRLLLRAAWAPVRGEKPAPRPAPEPVRPAPVKAPPPDRDKDGVVDAMDACPDEPMGAEPDPVRIGCPAPDRDKDGVVDHKDGCPDEPAGLHPDPERPGCPAPDRDKDGVVDSKDACPDKPGAPSEDPKKNGCPGLVTLEGGKIRILKPVYFATDKDTILQKSFPVLEAVAEALRADAAIKKLAIEGHTDDRGAMTYNTDLSARRAASVVRFLLEKGVAKERLTSQGYGPLKPIDTNATAEGRSKNRRVEFRILDPAM